MLVRYQLEIRISKIHFLLRQQQVFPLAHRNNLSKEVLGFYTKPEAKIGA